MRVCVSDCFLFTLVAGPFHSTLKTNISTLSCCAAVLLQSMVGPEVWAQAETAGVASNRLLHDVISSTCVGACNCETEEWEVLE